MRISEAMTAVADEYDDECRRINTDAGFAVLMQVTKKG